VIGIIEDRASNVLKAKMQEHGTRGRNRTISLDKAPIVDFCPSGWVRRFILNGGKVQRHSK
jgi:hypothetical protein